MRGVGAIFGAVLLVALWGGAASAEQELADPLLEARAQTLFEEIACLVCEGQSIAASEAAVAAEMRMRVRADVAAGFSNNDVREHVAAEYGDAALLRPPIRGGGVILWLAPLLFLGIGGAIAFAVFFRK